MKAGRVWTLQPESVRIVGVWVCYNCGNLKGMEFLRRWEPAHEMIPIGIVEAGVTCDGSHGITCFCFLAEKLVTFCFVFFLLCHEVPQVVTGEWCDDGYLDGVRQRIGMADEEEICSLIPGDDDEIGLAGSLW
eukprot:s5632_g7.t1